MTNNPFTRTPGIAGSAYIDMHYSDEIINNFESTDSSKYVYKIVGLRGSGKSVEYGKIIKKFKDKKDWLVYTLSAAGNPIETLIGKISKESFIDDKRHDTTVTTTGSIKGNAAFISGETSGSTTSTNRYNEHFYSQEATLDEMFEIANNNGYKILIGIDDISKTKEMIRFLSIFGAQLLEQRNIYLLCTGISQNIEDFSNESNLTFFKRGDSITISSLNKFEIASMYKKLLHIDDETSIKMAKFVGGYAYAYQVLGSLYANKDDKKSFEDLIPEFDRILSQDSYDLIWKTLSDGEKSLVKCILNSKSGKVSDIKGMMKNPSNFDVLRERLNKKHLIDTSVRGYISIHLPRFKNYIELWQD